eukprot:6180301-Pleurochrysis_carterae.AAC.3
MPQIVVIEARRVRDARADRRPDHEEMEHVPFNVGLVASENLVAHARYTHRDDDDPQGFSSRHAPGMRLAMQA